jgi:ubiquinone/menaquinone biosynthesis C-methylase UbiE
MSSPATDSSAYFARVAAAYDELRPADERWWEVYDAIVEAGDLRGRRVLELGCGTGRLAAALAEREVARVWGIDASEEMAAVARENGVHAKVARAERLPFKSGWFDRAVSRMAIHLFDRARAFAELRRVLAADGRAVIATMDPDSFERHWLLPYFPGLVAADRARFPAADALERELAAAGFAVELRRFEQEAVIDRETALGRIRGRSISTFDLLGEDAYREGLARAEAEFPERVEYRPAWLIALARPAL